AVTLYVDGEALGRLGASVRGWRFPHLVRLHFHGADDGAVRSLAECPFAPDLRVLDLRGHHLSPEGMSVLGRSGRFAGLGRLGLEVIGFDDGAARVLAASPGLPELRRLDLHVTRVREEGLDAITASPHLPHLEVISVGLSGAEPFPSTWPERYAHRALVVPPPVL